ncbi:MAG: hypothetical protein LBV33_06855 [Lachnospiraceae bacterium]|jgi:dipicolinate synthase subunit A|nr:hypothetical protein [Lachnospiraceae bacterium]
MDQHSAIWDFAILGGDMRQNYLANYLNGMGHRVTCLWTPTFPSLSSSVRTCTSLTEAIGRHSIVVGPVPFSRDGITLNGDDDNILPLTVLYSLLDKNQILFGGNFSPAVLTACFDQAVKCFDLMSSEAYVMTNALITAEGMVAEIINNTPFVLDDAPILILGFGRCGNPLAGKLKALGCRVSVCEPDPEKRKNAVILGCSAFTPAELKNALSINYFKIVVNTVPSPILDSELIGRLSPDTFLFDLSSPPGGIDFETARKCLLPVFHCLGLPGKTAPRSAGEAIGKTILELLERMYVHV